MTDLPGGGSYGRCEGSLRSSVHRRLANACAARANRSSLVRAGLERQSRTEAMVGLYGDVQIGGNNMPRPAIHLDGRP